MWLFWIIISLIILGSFAYTTFRSIGWVPMWSKDVKSVMDLAGIKSGDKFCDLGCGDGKVILAAGQAGAKAVGYEISLLFYLIAKFRSWISRYDVTVKFRDFWLVNLSDADVVFFFLIPHIYPKMKNKLEKELKSGAKIIAYVWPFEGWQPVKKIKRDKGPSIYLYIKK